MMYLISVTGRKLSDDNINTTRGNYFRRLCIAQLELRGAIRQRFKSDPDAIPRTE